MSRIVFADFGVRRHAPQPVPVRPGEEKPEMTWQICPVTKRPVMVWTLPEPASLPVAASA
jgi:hypothetical protein